MDNIEISTMTRQDLEWALEMAAAEGWNPGLHDADAFYTADPDGFIVARSNGEPVGCVSAVDYAGEFGFIGFYIVRKDLRGRRVGIELGNAAMDRLDGMAVGVDGVFDKQQSYANIGGFAYAWSNIRYEFENIFSDVPVASAIKSAHEVSFQQLEQYDLKHFPAPRTGFLEKWINLPESEALVMMDSDDENIIGFGVIRKCRTGYKIGPLFADAQIVAEMLMLALCSFAEQGALVYLDVPDANPLSVDLAESLNMKKVFGTARMYIGDVPDIAVENIYGITSFELG